MKRVTTYTLKKWVAIVALGIIFLPLLCQESSWPINGLLYVIFAVGYCTFLLVLRIFTFSDAVAVGRAFRSKNTIFNVSKSVGKEYLDN